MSLTTIQAAELKRIFAELTRRVAAIEAMLQGQPINSVRIKDAAITNAKIVSLSADKITSGQISVSTNIDIGSSAGGNYIRQDGNNVLILMYKSGTPQLAMGDV